MQRGPWCNDRLKTTVLDKIRKINLREDLLPSAEAETGGVSDLRIPDGQGSVVQRIPQTGYPQTITGFPTRWTQYCTGELKGTGITDSRFRSVGEIGVRASKPGFSDSALKRGADKSIVQYLGIASDEPERIVRHTKPGFLLPLVEIGWDEDYCRRWCEERGLLSPIYTTAARGGCWFCHNQGVDQLRLLRMNYPDLWALLLKWDLDSPVTFHADGRTVHDFEKRFRFEDEGKIPQDRRFRWKMLEEKTE